MKKIYILYKLNRYDLNISEPTPTKEILPLICAKLSLNPGRFHLRRNNEPLAPITVIQPLESLELCATAPVARPGMVKCLWQIAQQVRQEQTLINMANECYQEMCTIMERAAGYGQFECTILVESLVGWKWALSLYPTLVDKVEKLLKVRLNDEGLHPHIIATHHWLIEWKQDEAIIPLITARDLIEMGFFPPNARFASILNQLRGAIIEGVVPRDVRDAQIDWVRKNFIV
jgi:hypothetical protein